MKPVLLSAFVFPGSGYFLLKKPVQGIISALLVTIALVVFVKEALYKSTIISQRIVNGDIAIDIAAIQQAIINTPGQVQPQTLAALSWLLLVVWLWGTIDCYRLSKKSPVAND